MSIPSSIRRKVGPLAAGLFLVVAAVGHSMGSWTLPGLEGLERTLYDARIRLTAPGGVEDRVVILDIDEKSLAELGRWPWNRALVGKVVDTAFNDYGVATLGFDVLFSESERDQISSLVRSATGREAAPGLLDALDTDARLGAALKDRPAVLAQYFSSDKGATNANSLGAPILTTRDLDPKLSDAPAWRSYTANVAPVTGTGARTAHINSFVDDDGVTRRVPLLARYGDGYYEAMSLALVRQLLGNPPVTPVIGDAGGYRRLEALKVGPFTLPVDHEMAALVPFRGPTGSFKYVSIADLVAHRVPADALAGRVAIIGTSAPGLRDQRSTPTDNILPGVEVHASLITGVLDGAIRDMPAWIRGADVAQVALCGLGLVLVLPWLNALWSTAVTILVLAGLTALNLHLWTDEKLVMPVATAFAVVIAAYVVNIAWGYFVEGRTKRQLGDLFGQYVPPELVDEMAADPSHYSMTGRDAELTVMFSDVRGFTGISEQLSAEDLAAYINEYLTRMSAIIAERRGTLDKFIGDAIMAFWGAPVPDAESAEHAVDAALAMQREADRLSQEFIARGWPPFHIGVGLNTGHMVVGDMGSKLRRAYTVMGDTVNLASRLEGLTKGYGVGVIVGAATRDALPHRRFRLLDRVRVKGKLEAVEILEPLAIDDTQDLGGWERAIAAYFAQQWDAAEREIAIARADGAPGELCDLYLERIAAYRLAPPPADWDGVTTFTTK